MNIYQLLFNFLCGGLCGWLCARHNIKHPYITIITFVLFLYFIEYLARK